MDIISGWHEEGETVEEFNPYKTSINLLRSKCKHKDENGNSTIVFSEGKEYCTRCGKIFGGGNIWKN